ncbi:hypothetical protein BJ912DRAFT_973931 [Pholiota molesta]|nr:hypothetical protein BJ912DRAFT_973931 [Pholiota molesta]
MPPMDRYTKIYAGPGGLPTITYTTAVRLASTEMIALFAQLRVSVTTELLPVAQLTNSDTLMPVIREVFNCYRFQYKGTQIIHQDISPSNIMYWEDGKKKYASRQRMATMPYMAIDLLKPIPTKHLYRHDLEWLFYVIFHGAQEDQAILDSDFDDETLGGNVDFDKFQNFLQY